jgi:hypothetical protein
MIEVRIFPGTIVFFGSVPFFLNVTGWLFCAPLPGSADVSFPESLRAGAPETGAGAAWEGRPSGAPHFSQNRAPGTHGDPQDRHDGGGVSMAPQESQKRSSGPTFSLQLGQDIPLACNPLSPVFSPPFCSYQIFVRWDIRIF